MSVDAVEQAGDGQRVKLRMNQAIVRALADEMAADPSVVVYGEDVASAGGVFKTSVGLLEQFGPGRVRDTPISEMAICGSAVGAAIGGLRPVVEVMFVEFYGIALDQVTTQAAKLHYLTGGAVTVPAVFRGSCGAGRGFGATHSQTLETWFMACPGLKVAVASGANSAYALLRAAIRDDAPVVFLEPKALYGEREEAALGDAAIATLGVAHVERAGDDVTVVALGNTVGRSLRAASLLHEHGISCEVIDLRTIRPWDRATVLDSVAQTGRLVIVEENPLTGGWGNEIGNTVAAELFGGLDAPVLRVCCPDVPVPHNRELEARFVPTADYIAAQIRHLAETGQRPKHWWEAAS
jgi:pyruvate dehydrogenase E1 component beta subunit